MRLFGGLAALGAVLGGSQRVHDHTIGFGMVILGGVA